MGSGLPRAHLKHAACSPNFAHCVPCAVHDKLRAKILPRYSGRPEQANDALHDFYRQTWASLAADFVMGDEFRFWQGRFDAVFATADPVKPKPHEPHSTVPGVEETARKYLSRTPDGAATR